MNVCFSYSVTDAVTSSLADLGLSTGTLLVAVSVLFLMYNWPVWDRHLYPPGPLPLPFVGFTLWMAKQRDSDKALYGKSTAVCLDDCVCLFHRIA